MAWIKKQLDITSESTGYYLWLVDLSGQLLRYIQPEKLLSIYALLCILLSFVAIYAEGKNVVLALGGLGFFMSIMFPTIFSLGIKDLNENTKPASSLIVMSIIGGAIFSVIMGKIIDNYGDDIQNGYIVPLMCFFVVLYFGIKGHQPKTQILN